MAAILNIAQERIALIKPGIKGRRRHTPYRLYALILTLFIVLGRPTGEASAYEGDHYALTYYLAMLVGFTRRQAYQIASGTYALDWDANTSPMEASPADAIFRQ